MFLQSNAKEPIEVRLARNTPKTGTKPCRNRWKRYLPFVQTILKTGRG